MSPKQTFFVFLQKIPNMKRFLMIAALSVLLIGLGSCQKNKYCQCYAYVEGEDISLGEDLDVGAMTEEQIEAWDSRDNYNLYIIEHGNCSDKAREITGWGQVTCGKWIPSRPKEHGSNASITSCSAVGTTTIAIITTIITPETAGNRE